MMEHFEKTLSKDYKYNGKIINMRVDETQLENGKTAIREVVEHSGGVCVAALDEESRLLMVRQFRYPYSEVLWEIPAGKREKGEDPLECGKRELEEETGYTAEKYTDLGKLYPTPAYVDEVIYMYYAENLSKTRQHLDEDEFLTVERVPFDDAVKMVMNGEIRDAKTQVAILKLKELIK